MVQGRQARSPEDIGAGGHALVDVLRQPPLHGHVPVPHALPHPHAEVCAVAVDVADGLIIVLQCSRLLQTGGWRMRVGDRHATQPGPFSTPATVPVPMLRRGSWADDSPLAVTVARATGEGSPDKEPFWGRTVKGGRRVHQ